MALETHVANDEEESQGVGLKEIEQQKAGVDREGNERRAERDIVNENFRVPPHNLEAEQSVLGAMMLDRNATFTATNIVKAEFFYREAHRKIFQAIVNLDEKRDVVDIITLSNELKKMNCYEDVGGVSALTTLIERVPTAANIEYYAQIVKEKAVSRRMIGVLTQSIADLYSESAEVLELSDKLFDFFSKNDEMNSGDFDCDMGSLTLDVHSKIRMAKSGERKPHVPTGFTDFDQRFLGWERGALTVIIAPPKIGKSQMMINSFSRTAREFGTKAGYIILDMTRQTVVLRMLSQRLSLTVHEIQSPSTDILKIADELHEIGKLPIKIAGEENVGHDIKRILRWMTYARRFFGIEIFFVDSFSKIDIKPDRGQTDESYTSQMINMLQTAAKTLDVPIVGTVDLNYDGNAKGSSRWGFGPDNVFKFSLSEDGNQLIVESKFLRNHGAGKITLTTNYRWAEVRDYVRH